MHYSPLVVAQIIEPSIKNGIENTTISIKFAIKVMNVAYHDI